jgi:hypothetical protein
MPNSFLFRFFVGSFPHVLCILLQQEVAVLSADKFRRGDIVLAGLQPIHDLVGGPLIYLSAFGAKLGQYLVQAGNGDLCAINKP